MNPAVLIQPEVIPRHTRLIKNRRDPNPRNTMSRVGNNSLRPAIPHEPVQLSAGSTRIHGHTHSRGPHNPQHRHHRIDPRRQADDNGIAPPDPHPGQPPSKPPSQLLQLPKRHPAIPTNKRRLTRPLTSMPLNKIHNGLNHQPNMSDPSKPIRMCRSGRIAATSVRRRSPDCGQLFDHPRGHGPCDTAEQPDDRGIGDPVAMRMGSRVMVAVVH
ncbi:hypothetical protein Ahu01nite_026290 [Winogradskya humida]|uniref:Uncharacterized protein n=1 Tax=Winogradskya humida TaxID=113566 RepID=A0ABQ3ZLX6_9ACTN|nr:hypothetical protein Ahu01nite_026290 [Actinoplanes humidus]